MDKHFRAPSDVLGCNNKNFVSTGNKHKFRIAKFPDVGVKESANKMVPHEPFHLVLLSRPRVIAKSMSGNCLDVSIQSL